MRLLSMKSLKNTNLKDIQQTSTDQMIEMFEK